jgi:transposase-like protein
VTIEFLQAVQAEVTSGLSVSEIERQYGFNNRAIRRAKAELYNTGKLPQPVGYQPKANRAQQNI